MRVCPFNDCGRVVFGKKTYCSAMVYFGTMNISTRYVDTYTVMLVCGYPEALPTLEAFVERLNGASVIEQSPLGIPMLEGLASAEALREMAPQKIAA
jgi:hypothetical protein